MCLFGYPFCIVKRVFFSCIYPCKMDGIIVRRVIPSDNSCLFNAVGYVTDHEKNKAPELRQILICYILSLLLNMCS
ncbi:hypothetical protein Patl1_34310 [Pistacia atlantica]|uniref:Uncharacterized protein n=1 Tax=Pistacia atlantica TaxID=434234 RepID=A0ACC0ZPF1_9ROSI|nr:hypothetical protein Patl1_34310 [Pistacia atlantica]